MSENRSKYVGMRRGAAIANLTIGEQLDLIAEGMPILFNSAEELINSVGSLDKYDRTSSIIKGIALEELAKILILVDLVRCPEKIRSSNVGKMMSWYYSHLARIIYVDVQTSTFQDVAELRQYLENRRQSHYLEGYSGELIAPNFDIFMRENNIYADLFLDSDGVLSWFKPISNRYLNLTAVETCLALRNTGALTRDGLDVLSETWGELIFSNEETYQDAECLTKKTLHRLQEQRLFLRELTEDQITHLIRFWQMPMYDMNLNKINVSIEELREFQERSIYAQMYC